MQSAPQGDPYIGREIEGQYRIIDKIGSGGMGAVYRAEQPSMQRFVGIKILHSKYLSRTDLVARFRREARAMSHLSHPNTAKVYVYGQLDDGSCYFVMEYLEGCNLAQAVKRQGPMDPKRAVNILVQACGALEEAHRQGIIHRDLKPENIFLSNQGGIHDFVKVLDFGLAKVTEREMKPGSLILTQEGMVFGTPEFMSPEQAKGEKLDGRSDIYSLAMILYEVLTGKLPFDAKHPMEFVQKHVKEDPIPLNKRDPSLVFPKALEKVLTRAMEKDPNKRYATATEFSVALEQSLVLESLRPPGFAEPQKNEVYSPEEQPQVPQQKKLGFSPVLILIVGSVLTVVGLGALGVAWWMLSSQQ